PQFFMIGDAEETENENPTNDALETQADEVQGEISFHAIFGTILPQTLRLPGRIQNKYVVVLVDGGSTHNFVDQELVNRLGLQVDPNVNFSVVVANREKLACTGRVQNLSLVVQGCVISTDFFVLPVAACPIVLGVQWLKSLGPIEFDFNNLTLGFHIAGSHHKLQGFKASKLSALKSHELMGICDAALLLQIVPVFQEPSRLPPPRLHDHSIPLLPGSKSMSSRPYRQPYFQKNETEKQVRERLSQGLIRPSHSPFSSPVLLVKKSDDSWRFCVDYRALNDITIKDKYPIPMIDELLDELYSVQIFSKLDLRSGYHQIRVREDDIHKTAFRTHEGHYEFLVMPFGLTNAPSTFQWLMNDLSRPFIHKFILVFFDDILIYSPSMESHLQHLHITLKLLEDQRLFAKASKCGFGVSEVNYLGHVISANGVAVENSKVQAVLSWPTPKSAKGVRGFLGLAGYYRKFIKDFGSIATPLHRAVLTQNGHPLAYYSAPLKGTMLTLSTYEKEMLALVKSGRKWRHYLLGQEAPTVIHEDNAAYIAPLKDGYIKVDRTKHILPKFFFTHDLQKNGDIIIQHIRSSANLAYLFTKALPTTTFKKLVHGIGMRRLN
nr:transposon Ty3-G Gag-Pol polyprotein [Tanacetum cinerariifolium]